MMFFSEGWLDKLRADYVVATSTIVVVVFE